MSAPLKRQAVIRLVRAGIAAGTLRPGAPAPSGAALAEQVGCNSLTARAAVRMLIADGTLVAGPSRSARPRVALPAGAHAPAAEALARELSATLASRRRAAGLNQPELAAKLQVSVTTVGHGETGRLWQARRFWKRADELLGGGLLELYDRYSVARAMTREPDGEEPPAPIATVLPVNVAITAEGVAVTWPDGSTNLVRPPEALSALPR